MQVIGKIRRIEPVKQVSESFKSQELVVDTEEQYTQTISLQFSQDKCSLLDNYKVGDKVKVEFNLQGKEVIKEGKPPMVFNTLKAWKIEKAI